MIYLLTSAAYDNGKWFKIGYTSNLDNRLKNYITDNPSVELLETVQTYGKTKMRLEKQVHREVLTMGFQFQIKMGTKNEWFYVPEEKTAEFERLGLQQFKCCQGRKIKKWMAQQ